MMKARSIGYINKNYLFVLKNKEQKKMFIEILKKGSQERRSLFLINKLDSSNIEEVGTSLILIEEFFKTIGNKYLLKIVQLLEHESLWIRQRASGVLIRFANKVTLPMIAEGLKDKNDLVRSNLIEALGKIKSDRSTDLILSHLKDNSDLVRVCAIESAVHLKLKRAIPQFKKLLNDKDFLVREFAVSGLYALYGKKSLPILEERLKKEKNIDVATELMVASYFCEPKENILNDFIEMLNDQKSFVRKAAINNFPRLLNKKNKQKIIETLKITIKKESDKGLRKQIRKNLKTIVEKRNKKK